MTDHKTESEPREEDEELRLEKEKIRDLDVPDEEGKNVKAGRAVNSDTCGNCWGHTDSCTCGNCW